MRDVACYLCGSEAGEVLFEQEGHDPYLALVFDARPDRPLSWMVCRGCGFVYRSPVLEPEELETLYAQYEEDVFADTDPDEYFDKIITLPAEVSENQQKVDWLGDVLDRPTAGLDRGLRVLDIGCGGGTLAHTLAASLPVRELCGVELNPAYAALAARRLDADIRNQAYERGLFGGVFDLLVCTKVLEHVPDPLPFLREMWHDLHEDGFLFLEVPDLRDMFSLPPDHERFWIPHIHFFSEHTLTELLRRAGFDVREARVVTTSRGRAYLQVLAVRREEGERTAAPYDSAVEVLREVEQNLMKQRSKRENEFRS